MAEDWTPKDNWSPSNHNHDDKYYTQSDVDALVSGGLRYPDYANEVVLDEGTTTYTATQDGWIFAYARRNDTHWHVRINGIWVWTTGGSSYDAGSCFLPIKSGDVVTIHGGHSDTDMGKPPFAGAQLKFYPNR